MNGRTIIDTEDVTTAVDYIMGQIADGYVDFSEGEGDYRCGVAVAIIRDAVKMYKLSYTKDQIVNRLVNSGNYAVVTEKEKIKVDPKKEEVKWKRLSLNGVDIR